MSPSLVILPVLSCMLGGAPGNCSVTLEHAFSDEIDESILVACGTPGATTAANSFYRSFELPAFGVDGPFLVSAVDVGIAFVNGCPNCSYPFTVNLYLDANGGEPALNDLELIGTSENSTVVGYTPYVLAMPLVVTVPAGATIVAEFTYPEGSSYGNPDVEALGMWPGANKFGQSGPSYMRAEACGIDEITDLADLGFPDVSIILDVRGTPVGCQPIPACGDTVITHSLDQAILPNNSVRCDSGTIHVDNWYYRWFVLNDHGLGPVFQICGVEIGIQSAESLLGSQSIEVRLYDTADLLAVGSNNQIAELVTTIENQSLTIAWFPLSGLTTTGELAVEVFTPHPAGLPATSFFIGSNNLGQTAPSYLKAPDCGIDVPTDLAETNPPFPDVHYVFNVHGTELDLPPGDLNCDEVLDVADIDPFALALIDPGAYRAAYPGCSTALADLNGDEQTDGEDVAVFVDLLVGP